MGTLLRKKNGVNKNKDLNYTHIFESHTTNDPTHNKHMLQ